MKYLFLTLLTACNFKHRPIESAEAEPSIEQSFNPNFNFDCQTVVGPQDRLIYRCVNDEVICYMVKGQLASWTCVN